MKKALFMPIALVLIALVLIIKWVKHSSRIVFRALGLKISTSWEKYHRRVCSVCCFFHLWRSIMSNARWDHAQPKCADIRCKLLYKAVKRQNRQFDSQCGFFTKARTMETIMKISCWSLQNWEVHDGITTVGQPCAWAEEAALWDHAQSKCAEIRCKLLSKAVKRRNKQFVSVWVLH